MSGTQIRKIAVIGADGQMGKLIADRSRAAGIDVHGFDKPLETAALRPALQYMDAVLLCVPVSAFNSVLETIVPLLNGKTILADICSVKELPTRAMLKAYEGPVVGTHPLFGPVIPENFPARVAVTEGRDEQAAQAVADLMSSLGFDPFITTVAEHDKATAYVQGLNFTTTVAYLAAMRQVPDIKNYMTPSLQRRLDAAQKMITADKELFALITDANPYLQETIRSYSLFLSIAAGGDLDLLANHAEWWWRKEERAGCV